MHASLEAVALSKQFLERTARLRQDGSLISAACHTLAAQKALKGFQTFTTCPGCLTVLHATNGLTVGAHERGLACNSLPVKSQNCCQPWHVARSPNAKQIWNSSLHVHPCAKAKAVRRAIVGILVLVHMGGGIFLTRKAWKSWER